MSLDKMHRTPNHPAVRGQRARLVPIDEYEHLSAPARRLLGQQLSDARAVRGLSREQVATALGLDGPQGVDYIARLEGGQVELDDRRAHELNDTLGIPAPYLLAVLRQYEANPVNGLLDLLPQPGTPMETRARAVSIIGVITAAVLSVLMLLAFTAGQLFLCALALTGAWIALSPAAAILSGALLAARNRRG